MQTQVESWLLSNLDGKTAKLRVLQNGVPQSLMGTQSERSTRVHSLAKDTLRRALMDNLQHRSADAETGEPATVHAPLQLPPPDSPYGVRLAYVTGAMNMQRELQRSDFDSQYANWELDIAANDVGKFDTKVRAMVTGVVAALLGRTYDSRHEAYTSGQYDIATALGIITPLTLNLEDVVEQRESRFAMLLQSRGNVIPPFVTEPEDLDLVARLHNMREAERQALLVSDTAFNMTRQVELDFLKTVLDTFQAARTSQTRTLVKQHEYLPAEGEEFEIREVTFVGGPPEGSTYSLGNGSAFVVECAEVAQAYIEAKAGELTDRKTLRRAKLTTENRTKDGKIRTWTPEFTTGRLTSPDLKKYFMDAGVLVTEQQVDLPETDDDTSEPFYLSELSIDAVELGTWLANGFRGYCYQRQHTLERPLFAKLVDYRSGSDNEIAKLDAAATAAGFVNLATSAKPGTTNKVVLSRYHYYRALRAAGGSDQTGRRIRHLGRYYVVSLCSTGAFSTRSYMRYDEFWGPTLEHAAVETEACAHLSTRARIIFAERKRPRNGRSGDDDYPPLVQTIGEAGCTDFSALFIFEEGRMIHLAARLIRLVQTVQACNEVFRDAGTRNRTSVAREDLFAARAAAIDAVLTYQ